MFICFISKSKNIAIVKNIQNTIGFYSCKRLIIVNAKLLEIVFYPQLSFKLNNITIYISFYFIDLFFLNKQRLNLI